MHEAFKKYVNNFDVENEHIKGKYYHSLRVSILMKRFAKTLKMSKQNILVAEHIGLLHDIGRFSQLADYQTFDDLISIDHGDLGIDILFDQNLIEDYDILEEDYAVLKDAIIYHNKNEISDKLTEKSLIFAKLIRDCDKIDILNLIIEKRIDLPDDYYFSPSEKVRRDFMDYKTIDSKDLENNSDKILQKLALIFDLNYKISYEYIRDYDILAKIYYLLEEKETLKEYFDEINEYINRQCKE